MLAARALGVLSCYKDVRHFHSYSLDDQIKFCFAGSLNPHQVPEELNRLAEIVTLQRPKSVLEIGTAHGGTLWLWCQIANPGATIASLDLPHGKFGGGYHWARIPLYRSFEKPWQTLKLIRRDSHSSETQQLIQQIFPQGVEFLFIDGDHSYAGVKQDFEMYSPLVVSGGIIALHDVAPHATDTGCEAARFWDELKPRYRHEEIISSQEQGWAGIGVLYV